MNKSTSGHIYGCICDLNGVLRGKRIGIDQLEKIQSGQVRMAQSLTSMDIWGNDIEDSPLVYEHGDGDGVCIFTGRGPLPLSWLGEDVYLAPLWMQTEDGDPFPGDVRYALASVVDKFAELGLTPVVATELEFYLYDLHSSELSPPLSPHTNKRTTFDTPLALDELEDQRDFLNDVYAACKDMDISADAAIAEAGAGQFEVNLMHVADPLKAADDTIFFKKLVRGIAQKHGMGATFMAKPYGNRPGNGFHVHFSLIDADGRNVFDDGTDAGSDIMRHAVAGLIDTMQENTLIFAAHENSYRRMLPGCHAPTVVSWAYENRTSAIRIPGGPAVARRIEHRVAGADANPYLVLTAILGGALIGIQDKLQAPDPVTGDVGELDLPSLPTNWGAGIDAFEQGTLNKILFPPLMRDLFIGCKRQEHHRFRSEVTALEQQTYLSTI
ncbi:MAG: glutamine synthetase [Rhodobacteraceae bacterium]|nr:glutamine synthetase [Paracoccaceae bacterium]